MITMRAQAKGTGRVVNWSKFKQGELVDQGRLSLSPTTVIPDVVTDVIAACRNLAGEIEIKTIIPNGFTTTGFDIAILGRGLRVNCSRRLVRGGFPFNILAAEFGANYDVLLTISAEDPMVEEKIAGSIRGKYRCQTEC
jgi:hypothetical protein